MTRAFEPLAFSVTTTLNDVMAAEAGNPAPGAKTPFWRRRRVIFFTCMFVAVVGGGLASTDDPAGFAKMLLTTRLGVLMLVCLAMLALFLAGLQQALKAFNARIKRSIYAHNRRRHPATDARDPALPMARSYRFDDTGMTTGTACDELWESWGRITGLDETADLLIVRIGGGILSYPLPKRQLAPELRERLQHFVDSRSSTKWPF